MVSENSGAGKNTSGVKNSAATAPCSLRPVERGHSVSGTQPRKEQTRIPGSTRNNAEWRPAGARGPRSRGKVSVRRELVLLRGRGGPSCGERGAARTAAAAAGTSDRQGSLVCTCSLKTAASRSAVALTAPHSQPELTQPRHRHTGNPNTGLRNRAEDAQQIRRSQSRTQHQQHRQSEPKPCSQCGRADTTTKEWAHHNPQWAGRELVTATDTKRGTAPHHNRHRSFAAERLPEGGLARRRRVGAEHAGTKEREEDDSTSVAPSAGARAYPSGRHRCNPVTPAAEFLITAVCRVYCYEPGRAAALRGVAPRPGGPAAFMETPL
ncbi:hypothetical protein HPB48_025501 [Haemaphysalis longicornis]|uniref:Uncharacterized protein n=1 Tax=Haemaphysalis longicornis TaxID=44386 RepID=A0A9J6GZ60_HAELO|nr:hypothetical protein HPB48_025501 [Haemaphysalis longicornis]